MAQSARPAKLSAHQKLLLYRLRKGDVLKAALKRGSEGNIFGMGRFHWYDKAGVSMDQRAITMDTLMSMRKSGVLRIEDSEQWTTVILNG